MTLKSNQCIIIMFSTHARYLLNRFSCVQLFVTVRSKIITINTLTQAGKQQYSYEIWHVMILCMTQTN